MSECLRFRSEPGRGLVFACRLESGHDGLCVFEETGAPVTAPTGRAEERAPRCGELSPGGEPCLIPKFAHRESWGPAHSWEQCTSRWIYGWPKTRCEGQPGHAGVHMISATWPNNGEMEGLSI